MWSTDSILKHLTLMEWMKTTNERDLLHEDATMESRAKATETPA